jgi:hypothetical protein
MDNHREEVPSCRVCFEEESAGRGGEFKGLHVPSACYCLYQKLYQPESKRDQLQQLKMFSVNLQCNGQLTRRLGHITQLDFLFSCTI